MTILKRFYQKGIDLYPFQKTMVYCLCNDIPFISFRSAGRSFVVKWLARFRADIEQLSKLEVDAYITQYDKNNYNISGFYVPITYIDGIVSGGISVSIIAKIKSTIDPAMFKKEYECIIHE